MCSKGKCMYCLEVVTGSLIYAILQIMTTSLGVVLSLCGLVYTCVISQEAIIGDDVVISSISTTLNAVGLLFFAVVTVVFCILLAFAIVLIVGLCKRQATLVKCYFVFGVIKAVCGIALFVIAVCLHQYPVVILLVIPLFIYIHILVMIHKTYKKFEMQIDYNIFTTHMSAIVKN